MENNTTDYREVDTKENLSQTDIQKKGFLSKEDIDWKKENDHRDEVAKSILPILNGYSLSKIKEILDNVYKLCEEKPIQTI